MSDILTGAALGKAATRSTEFCASMSECPTEALGATPLESGECSFLVWAPNSKTVDLHILRPNPRVIPMARLSRGYFQTVVSGAGDSCMYQYALSPDKRRADPASRFQPEGVHGPSQVVSAASFAWTDAQWRGLPLSDLIFYEIHVGTFTPEGTFEAVIARLRSLRELGVTAVEVMPVAQFPGERNWGYDGTFPYAVQNSYGGPRGLQALVNACHAEGLCFALDVVYNHLGPEGNYLSDFGPYFTDRYRTPWGQAINYDSEGSDEVRRFFIQNALYWFRDFHVDILRLDAVHAIVDNSARPFLAELNTAVKRTASQLNREIHLIAECDRNDIRIVEPVERGGYALAAQWNDDFHHAVHTALTRETGGYYADFGCISQIAKALTTGFVYTGEYSGYRQRSHGTWPDVARGDRFVVFSQNHDQVGNRMAGERLAQLIDFGGLKVAAGVTLLSPFLPLLFMGEEYAESAPFEYFVSHGDAQLIENVRTGRRREFQAFGRTDFPDPQELSTYTRSKLHWDEQNHKPHKQLRNLHAELLRLRGALPPLRERKMRNVSAIAYERENALFLRRWTDGQQAREGDQVFALFNFGKAPASLTVPLPRQEWKRTLDSGDERWGGPGGSLPESLASDGTVRLELPPLTFGLYQSIARATPPITQPGAQE